MVPLSDGSAYVILFMRLKMALAVQGTGDSKTAFTFASPFGTQKESLVV